MEVIKKFSDLNLVAHLMCKEYPEASPPVIEGEHVFWYFKSTPPLEKEIMSYLNGDSIVNPLTFGYYLRYLRRVASELKRSSRGVNPNG